MEERQNHQKRQRLFRDAFESGACTRRKKNKGKRLPSNNQVDRQVQDRDKTDSALKPYPIVRPAPFTILEGQMTGHKAQKVIALDLSGGQAQQPLGDVVARDDQFGLRQARGCHQHVVSIEDPSFALVGGGAAPPPAVGC